MQSLEPDNNEGPRWKIEPEDRSAKRHVIEGPDGIVLYLDTDDVPPDTYQRMAEVVARLNEDL